MDPSEARVQRGGTGRVPESTVSASMEHKTKRVCVSKLQGIDTTGLMPCACGGKRGLPSMEHKTKSAASEGSERAQGVAFLSQLILDVLRGELSLIQHNTHEYISAKWLADW